MPVAHLIVGLGNPGQEYEDTRHNIGFMAIDAIAARYHCGAWKNKFKSLITAPIGTDDGLLFIKPQTFMNLSGDAVIEAAHFHKIPPEKIIVFHDDIDLPAAQVRVKQGGGHGGHNGLKSLDAHLGKDYWRVRIGVGRPASSSTESDTVDADRKNRDVSNYVLGRFAKSEHAWRDALIVRLAENFSLLLDNKMNDYAAKANLNSGEK